MYKNIVAEKINTWCVARFYLVVEVVVHSAVLLKCYFTQTNSFRHSDVRSSNDHLVGQVVGDGGGLGVIGKADLDGFLLATFFLSRLQLAQAPLDPVALAVVFCAATERLQQWREVIFFVFASHFTRRDEFAQILRKIFSSARLSFARLCNALQLLKNYKQ